MSVRVTIKDVKTGKVTLFASVTSCADFIKCDENYLHKKLNRKEIKIPFNGYFVKYDYEDVPWPEVAYTKKIHKSARAIILTNVITGEIKEFPTMRDAARFFNCNVQSIANQAVKKVKTNYKGYIVAYK